MLRTIILSGLSLLWTMGSLAAGEVELEIVRSVRVSFPTVLGKQYQILTSTDAEGGPWVPLGDPFYGTGKVFTFHHDTDTPDKSFFEVEETDGGLEEFIVPDLNLAMIPIAPGSFIMGSPSNEPGRFNDEGPQTTVTISRPFWLSKFEVTQGQYQELIGHNPSFFQNAGLDAPVESVTWNEAVEFCRRLTARERAAGRLLEGHEYRLPTDAQWEYACRAGTTTALYNGPIEILGERNAPAVDPIGWYGGNSGVSYAGGFDSSGWVETQFSHTRAGTHRVGQKQANAWGLHDMIGNVWEWCRDRYRGSNPGGSVTDPLGPSSGQDRVFRGGSWFTVARNCRSARRPGFGPFDSSLDLGFRPALVLVP